MKNKLRTKEQHEFMRMVKKFQNGQLSKPEDTLRFRDRSNKKITFIMNEDIDDENEDTIVQ